MSDAVFLALTDGLRAWLDGQANAWIEVYGGTQPAPGEPASADALIGIIPLPRPCGVATSAGLALEPATAQATGTGVPTWARLVSASGQWAIDGACGDVFALALDAGETVYPGGELIFSGGTIGF